MPIRVKVCCISSEEEAGTAVELGASALGLVSEMPSGPGVIPDDEIARIARTVPPGVSSFLLTCRQSAAEIIDQHRRCGTSTIQICDSLDLDEVRELRRELVGIRLVQVIHVRGEESIEEAEQIAPHVDAILLDSGNQALAIKELGGTGRTHDWNVSATIVRQVGIPVFLAGGLNASNVRRAIELVRPFGVDLCSGVRTEGQLDRSKLSSFMTEISKSQDPL